MIRNIKFPPFIFERFILVGAGEKDVFIKALASFILTFKITKLMSLSDNILPHENIPLGDFLTTYLFQKLGHHI